MIHVQTFRFKANTDTYVILLVGLFFSASETRRNRTSCGRKTKQKNHCETPNSTDNIKGSQTDLQPLKYKSQNKMETHKKSEELVE